VWWISKKKHNQTIDKLKKLAAEERCNHQSELRRQQAKHDEEIKKKIEPMVKKFIKVMFYQADLNFERYQLSIFMDTWWVEQCLLHGNSQNEIDYLAVMIGKKVGYELASILKSRNFERKNAL